MKRILKIKIFLGSTTEEIEEKMSAWLGDMCPGNYVDAKLYKHGSVYQLIFLYAELVNETN